MNSKKLKTIEELYHAALEISPNKRAPFIAKRCGGNEDLRREVESLLSFENSADNFLETPPASLAAEMFAERGERDLTGKKINHYEIIELLGRGGMGEVYLATDIKLKRQVAVKFLYAELTDNPKRLQRFEREAFSVSGLNHPNILTIHEFGTENNSSFIVTEFVKGATLREKIADGKFSLKEILDITGQIAAALAAAHEDGIIHRDIKPENIMIRDDGFIKVLDFGIAKLAGCGDAQTKERGEDDDETLNAAFPVLPVAASVTSGMILGTPNYMSPEQARGEKDIDGRSDIWSLGVVLYEMSVGKIPFKSRTKTDLTDAMLKDEPDFDSDISELPAQLQKIIKKTLCKNRSKRYQNVKEFLSDINRLKIDLEFKSKTETSDAPQITGEAIRNDGNPQHLSRQTNRKYLDTNEIVEDTAESKPFVPIGSSKKITWAIPILLLAGIGIFVYSGLFGSATDSPRPLHNLNFRQLTTNTIARHPSISPDGKTIVFAGRTSGKWNIFFRNTADETTINLTKDSPFDNLQPSYSPDGERIAFRSEQDGGGIFVMNATGENVRKVSDSGYHPAWSPDGREIVFSNGNFDDPTDRILSFAALWIVNVASGERRKVFDGDAVQPAWSPSGGRIAFWSANEAGQREIKTISAGGGDIKTATENVEAINWNPVWSPDGKYLYFASNSGGSMNFWRVPINEQTGETLGAPEPFTTPSVYSQNLTFSRSGDFLAYVQKVKSSNIFRAEFDPQTETIRGIPNAVTSGARYDRNPSVSPDGNFIVFDAIKNKQEDLFIMNADGGDVRRITNDANKDRAPRFSPDGRSVIFYSDRTDRYETWAINTDGSGLRQISFDTEPYAQLSIWSRDGKKILQNLPELPQIFDAGQSLTEQKPFKILLEDPKVWIMAFDWSPDGNKLAAMKMSDENPSAGVTVYSLTTGKYETETDFGESPVWLNDNRRLIFFDRNKIFLLNTATGKTKEILALAPEENLQGITVSPDNRFIYFSLQKEDSNIWLSTTE